MNEITEKQYQERIIALNREVTRLNTLIGATSYKSAYTQQKTIVVDRECKILELRQDIERFKDDLRYVRMDLRDLHNDNVFWWSQPWYKRVWSALRGAEL